MSLSHAPDQTPDHSLRKGRLGTLGIVFFVVAAAAPLVGMTGAVPVAIVLGNGAAAPGAYLIVGLTLLIFSVGYATMSSHVTNTGAFFAYVGRGLGISAGVGSAFASMVAYVGIQLAIYGFFGGVISGQMEAQFGIAMPWYFWTFLAWALVLVLSLLSVDIGAKVLGVLLTLEVGSLVAVAFMVLIKGGPEGFDIGASFSPANIIAGGLAGSAGIALAFAFASFIGFEATAIYGEESKDPKRTVPRATYLSVTAITVLFAVVSFAIVTAMGASKAVDRTVEYSSIDGEPLADPAGVLFRIASDYAGSWLSTLMSWLVLSSLFAGLLAFQNSAARYFFAMGRARVLPSMLDRTNRLGAPASASALTSALAGIVMVIFMVRELDPITNLFFWFSGVAVVAIVLVEVLVCAAVIVYFRRTRQDTRLWNTLIAPLIAAIGLLLGLYLLISRFGLLAGTVRADVDPTVQAFGFNTTGWILIATPFVMVVLGAIVGRLRRTRENEAAIRDLVS